MKKLILVFTAIAISVGVYAQTDSINRKMSLQELDQRQNQQMQNNPVDTSLSDGVTMHNGRIMMVKDGKMTKLEKDLTLSNGTKIMRDGSWTKKDGSKMSMKEGEHMDMSGKMIPSKTNKDRNMYLVPDSIKNKDF